MSNALVFIAPESYRCVYLGFWQVLDSRQLWISYFDRRPNRNSLFEISVVDSGLVLHHLLYQFL